MCGIVACRRGDRAQDFLLPALRRLEYRGYDSAGVTVTAPGQWLPTTVRAVGRLDAAAAQASHRRPRQVRPPRRLGGRGRRRGL